MSDEIIQPRTVEDIVKDLEAARADSSEITDEEVKTATPVWVTPAPEPPTVEEQKKECLDKLGQILKEHNGMESNIDLKHEYWDILATYRRLNANP